MYRPFFDLFPDLAAKETRNIFLERENGKGHDKYAFLELYCVDPNCDCRRVMFFAIKNETSKVACITYGFDPGPMQGPELDPLNPQSDEAEHVLSIAKELLLNDSAYLQRLERHYLLVKASLNETSRDDRRERWAQAKRKKKERKKMRKNRK